VKHPINQSDENNTLSTGISISMPKAIENVNQKIGRYCNYV
jgi:hypothetical protein